MRIFFYTFLLRGSLKMSEPKIIEKFANLFDKFYGEVAVFRVV